MAQAEARRRMTKRLKQEIAVDAEPMGVFRGKLDNARYLRTAARARTPAVASWKRLADAVKNGENELVSAQLSVISDYLEAQPAVPRRRNIAPYL